MRIRSKAALIAVVMATTAGTAQALPPATIKAGASQGAAPDARGVVAYERIP